MHTDTTSLPIIVLGFLLGMKHALDVDHLAAVSTIVAGQRSRWRSALVGAYWGIGHSVSLLVAGGIIVYFDLRFGPLVSAAMESVVGLMLIVLGGRVLLRMRHGGTIHVHAHHHGKRRHVHPHIHEPGNGHPGGDVAHGGISGDSAGHAHGAFGGRLSLLVGSIHGLAGSAALTLMLLPSMQTRLGAIMYLVVFGIGSILGMALSTYLVSIPLSALKAGGKAGRILAVCAGCLSLFVGIILMLEMGTWLFQR